MDWIQIALAIYFFARRTIARAALLLPGKAAARCAAAAKTTVESAD
ncbi:MAG TPA: hypothetical protein VFR84_04125 [Candidatus Angelobacter sp.]|nr:hypothetical protein [Candidatus Angelobacter sp.]